MVKNSYFLFYSGNLQRIVIELEPLAKHLLYKYDSWNNQGVLPDLAPH